MYLDPDFDDDVLGVIRPLTWICPRCGASCSISMPHTCYEKHFPKAPANLERIVALLEDILEELKEMKS